ncbi:MAG: CinA family protein [Methylococcales bacterium]|nr:CinA family protein [Methylococcales bacterium]MCK5925427.1 CinA family protein [Methylococcales bacterium]
MEVTAVDIELKSLITELGQTLQANNLVLSVAESCTGGGISEAITAIAGSSHWFDCGFVSYSNQSKIKMLAVKPKTLEIFGAVSDKTALEMVAGVLKKSQADSAVAVTGIAGPAGGNVDKPIGTIFIAWQSQNSTAIVKRYLFKGDRDEIRQQVIVQALKGVKIP